METNISPCPYCGSPAMVLHMVDTYDRADFGWDCGCARYSLFDKVHTDAQKERLPKVIGWASKEAAIKAWEEFCANTSGGLSRIFCRGLPGTRATRI